MNYIIVDLEATCRESGMSRTDMETIEVGAVELPSGREFQAFIRPVVDQELSAFCKNLTGISQSDVDRAETFPLVFQEFLDWAGAEPFTFCSWGEYDRLQLRQDCERHGVPWPVSLDNHLNVKKLFAQKMAVKPCGMASALHQLGMPLLGRHHRGIDDAHNIAAIFARLDIEASR
jgi:3'-5' exoribonuclease 1